MQNKEFDNIISTSIGKRKETLKCQPSIISNLKRELNAMKERYEQLEGANEDLRKNIKATKINELEADLQVYASECERLRKLIDEGLTNIPDVSNEQEKICADLESKLRAKLTEITSLNNTVSLKAQTDEQSSNSKQEAQRGKVAHDKEIAAIKEQLEELKSQNTQLSKELNNHKTSNTEISSKEKDLKAKISKYESESKFHKDEISKYKLQITQLQSNIKELSDKLPKEDLNTQLVEYQQKNKSIQEQLQLANKAVEQSKKAIEDSLSDIKSQLVNSNFNM
jgi:chromosome segregation ATPase